MAQLDEQLQNIQQKLQQLAKQYTALQKENVRLQAAIEKLKEAEAAQEAALQEMKQQNDILKSGIAGWHPTQKKVFIKRIDQYLREIDRCIAMLNE